MKQQVFEHIKRNKVFSVIRNGERFEPYDIARALIDGGLTTIEISMDIPNALDIIQKLSSENILLGACSVVTAQHVQEALEAGVQFVDTPVLEMSVIKFSKGDAQVPIIVGATTANEAYQSWKLNTLFTKVFPTAELGGINYISYLVHIMPFLKLIASSGIQMEDYTKYLDNGAYAVALGRCLYEKANSIKDITQNAKNVRASLEKYLIK